MNCNKSSLSITAGRIPFAFLEDIHNRFVKTYGRAILSAPAYTMNDEFSRVLSKQMDYYSKDPNADRLNRLKGEMTQASSQCKPIHSFTCLYMVLFWSSCLIFCFKCFQLAPVD